MFANTLITFKHLLLPHVEKENHLGKDVKWSRSIRQQIYTHGGSEPNTSQFNITLIISKKVKHQSKKYQYGKKKKI